MQNETVTDEEIRSLFRLCEAALMQALASLERACTTSDAYIERLDALDWIFASDRNHAFSFDNVCLMQGYDGDEMRDGIRAKCMTLEEKGIWL